MSSSLDSTTASSLTPSLPSGALSNTAASTLWMSADLVWTVLLVLLALSMLVSLRFDWLRVWWQDQWRQITAANEAEEAQSATVSLPAHPETHRHAHRREPAHAPTLTARPMRPLAHRTDRLGHVLAVTHPAPHPSPHRTLFHRSGKRH